MFQIKNKTNLTWRPRRVLSRSWRQEGYNWKGPIIVHYKNTKQRFLKFGSVYYEQREYVIILIRLNYRVKNQLFSVIFNKFYYLIP